MSFDFPASPVENQTFQPAGGPLYTYKAPAWTIQPTSAGVYVLKAGDTMTGDLSIAPAANGHAREWLISSGTGHSQLFIQSRESALIRMSKGDGANKYNYLEGMAWHVPSAAYKQRWQFFLGDNATETGTGNAGSNVSLRRYNDDGTVPAPTEILNVQRGSGYVYWDTPVTVFQWTAATSGITHYFDTYRATPADQDYIFNAAYRTKNRAGALTEFARMAVVALDIDPGTEASYFRFSVLNGSTALNERLRVATDAVHVTGNVVLEQGDLTGNSFIANYANVILACDNGGRVYIRPNGYLSSTGEFQVQSSGNGVCQAIMYADGYTGSTLGSAATTLVLGTNGGNGTLYFRGAGGTTTEQATYNYVGNFTIGGEGYKQVAGSWAAASDARIKVVTGDYKSGLAEIIKLQPRTFRFKGNEVSKEDTDNLELENAAIIARNAKIARNEAASIEKTPPQPLLTLGSPHKRLAEANTECIGLIAQEAEIPMPDLVKQTEAYIDGVLVEDFRVLDPTNITYALINAVKELDTRLRALEPQ